MSCVLRSAVGSLLLLLVLATSASASSTVRFIPREYPNGRDAGDVEPSYITIKGDGARNRIAVRKYGAKKFTIRDRSGITALRRCDRINRRTVRCPRADSTKILLRDGADRATVARSIRVAVYGGRGGDAITAGRGEVAGGGGNDVLKGNGNGGEFRGGDGDDLIRGGRGGERLRGGDGEDELHGGPGRDVLDGDGYTRANSKKRGERDVVDGGAGTDRLPWGRRSRRVVVDLTGARSSGTKGEDEQLRSLEIIETGKASDILIGSDAAEAFYPGAGKDDVSAGGGDDFVEASGEDSDEIDLGGGLDTVSYMLSQYAVNVNLTDSGRDGPGGALDGITGAENVTGSMNGHGGFGVLGGEDGDILVGDEGPNVLVGLNGSDDISGGGGADRLYGEGRPSDYSYAGIDQSPAAGPQICLCSPSEDKLHGGDGTDRLVGGIDNDSLDGGLGDDVLVGGTEPTKFGASEGESTEPDLADYRTRSAPITASTGSGGGEAGEADTYIGISGIIGGSGDDVLTGHASTDDDLEGGAGNDYLDGLGGQDELEGRSGNDVLIADDGQEDRLACGTDVDSYRADAADEVTECEAVAAAP